MLIQILDCFTDVDEVPARRWIVLSASCATCQQTEQFLISLPESLEDNSEIAVYSQTAEA
ncbi:MAG: hypothetical protein JXM73_13880 [Anaerolineae bacterium]|nr:hypothetical protein [Anaerolineae bacterium]